MAVRLLMREESDASQWVQERDRIQARIIAMAEPRDMGQEDVVEDYSNRWGVFAFAPSRQVRDTIFLLRDEPTETERRRARTQEGSRVLP